MYLQCVWSTTYINNTFQWDSLLHLAQFSCCTSLSRPNTIYPLLFCFRSFFPWFLSEIFHIIMVFFHFILNYILHHFFSDEVSLMSRSHTHLYTNTNKQDKSSSFYPLLLRIFCSSTVLFTYSFTNNHYIF